MPPDEHEARAVVRAHAPSAASRHPRHPPGAPSGRCDGSRREALAERLDERVLQTQCGVARRERGRPRRSARGSRSSGASCRWGSPWPASPRGRAGVRAARVHVVALPGRSAAELGVRDGGDVEGVRPRPPVVRRRHAAAQLARRGREPRRQLGGAAGPADALVAPRTSAPMPGSSHVSEKKKCARKVGSHGSPGSTQNPSP